MQIIKTKTLVSKKTFLAAILVGRIEDSVCLRKGGRWKHSLHVQLTDSGWS